MIFNVPKLLQKGAWIELTDANKGAANWRGLRDSKGVVGIVAHHSVTVPKHNAMAEVAEVDYIHRQINGWGGIGYNIIITTEEINGFAKAVLIGDLASIRAHTPNAKGSFGWQKDAGNWYLIGICMIGELHKYNPSDAQIKTFKAIAEELIYNEDARFPALNDWSKLFSHKQFDYTECSGNFDWQKNAIINANIGDTPAPNPNPTPTPDREPVYISVQAGDGYSMIAKRAGWSYWDDAPRVIADLKALNPNHPSFARGNAVWAGDPAFIVGYKDKPVPTPEPPKPDVILFRVKTDDKTVEFADQNLALNSYKELKDSIEEGKTVKLFHFNQTKNVETLLEEYTKPITPKPDLMVWRIVRGEEGENFGDKDDALKKFNELVEQINPGEKIELFELNKTQDTSVSLMNYTKPLPPVEPKKFNLVEAIINFIYNLFKSIWKR